jgi:hypothetical protein
MDLARLPENKTKYVHRNESSWIGGSFEELFSKKEIKRQASKIRPNAQSMITQRRRSRSEYDGDLNFDNKWDVKPYDIAEKKPTSKKIIKLNIGFNFSAKVEASEMDAQCDLIKAIVFDLEKNGYLIQINIFNDRTNATVCGKKSKMNFEIKKPNQYLNHQDLANVFTTNFYRRVFFEAMKKACDDVGLISDSSLGTPRVSDQAIEYKPNEIIFNSLVKNKTQEEVLKEIYAKI